MMRVLIVCTANVCRSPMAAALFARHCEHMGIACEVHSAGTHAGIVADDPDAIATMAQRGIDIAAHVPRLVTPALLASDGSDLIVTMTRAHLRDIALMGSGVVKRTFTAKELARRVVGVTNDAGTDRPATIADWLAAVGEGRSLKNLMGDDPDDDVDDPYGASLAAHQRTADELDTLMGSIAQSLALWLR